MLRRRDPADGRRNLLALSPAGVELLTQVRGGVDDVQRQLLEPLQADDREGVVALLMVTARLAGQV